MGLNRELNSRASIAGIEVIYRVVGMPDYDLDDNQEQYDKIQTMIEQGVKIGGVNFEYNEDLYTIEWKSAGMEAWGEEE